MILGFDIDSSLDLRYDVDGGEGYDDLAEEAIAFRNHDLDIKPLLENMLRDKLSLLSHLYGVPESMFENVTMKLTQFADGSEVFKIYGVLTFDVEGELPTISTDVLISRLIEYMENQLDNDIENIINVEPLKEMVNHDPSIDFQIDRMYGIGANVIETR